MASRYPKFTACQRLGQRFVEAVAEAQALDTDQRPGAGHARSYGWHAGRILRRIGMTADEFRDLLG